MMSQRAGPGLGVLGTKHKELDVGGCESEQKLLIERFHSRLETVPQYSPRRMQEFGGKELFFQAFGRQS